MMTIQYYSITKSTMLALTIAIAMVSVAVAGPVVTKSERVFVPQEHMVNIKSLPQAPDTELSKSMKDNIVNLDEKPVFKRQGTARVTQRRKALSANNGLTQRIAEQNLADKKKAAPQIRFEVLEKERAKMELQRGQSKKQ